MIESRRAKAGVTLVALASCAPAWGASTWGGTLGVSSDYLVRGITRSDDQAAVQGDLHYLHGSGLVAGIAASTVRFQTRGGSEVELDGFLGYAWRKGDDWQGKLIVSHYAYPWMRGRVDYRYDEMTLDAAFRGWLDLSVSYSPNYRRFVPYRGLIGTSDVSTEVNFDVPLRWHVAFVGGVGYSYLGGPDADGYVYGSAGFGANFDRWALTATYVHTSYDAKSLFYNAADTSRWVAAVVWRWR